MSKEFSNFTDNVKNNSQNDFSKNVKNHKPEFSEENIQHTISKVLSDLGDFLEEKKGEVCKTTKEYKNKLKEHPVGCTLAALALGVIIGAVLKK